ncbi:hypothetical protein LDC_1048, partial [sediment metagenome]
MKFQIDEKIFENYPDLKIGLILIKNFPNQRRVSALESLLRGIFAQRSKELKNIDIDTIPEVNHWNMAYNKAGLDFKEISPNIRTTLKKIQSFTEITHINPLLDLANFYALKYFLSIHAIDLNWICGDLRLAYTTGDEPFREINSIEVVKSAPDEVAYLDQGGIIARHFNFRECERTRITDRTQNAGLFIEDLSRLTTQNFTQILGEIASSVQKYLGGDIVINILSKEALTA